MELFKFDSLPGAFGSYKKFLPLDVVPISLLLFDSKAEALPSQILINLSHKLATLGTFLTSLESSEPIHHQIQIPSKVTLPI